MLSVSTVFIKVIVGVTLLCVVSGNVYAQNNNRHEMTPQRMAEIIVEYADTSQVSFGVLQFTYKDVNLALIADSSANRMRIIAPIIEASALSDQMILATLVSNYHLALDARYAITDGTMYAAYVHPLKELSQAQIESAVRQVASLHNTFGTSYTSGDFLFGIQNNQEKEI